MSTAGAEAELRQDVDRASAERKKQKKRRRKNKRGWNVMNNFTSDRVAEGVREAFENEEKASAREELSERLRAGLNFCSALRKNDTGKATAFENMLDAGAAAEVPGLSPRTILGKSFTQKKLNEEETDTYVLGVILTQYSLKKGLKKFEGRAEEAVEKELNQFHDLRCFDPVDPSTLTRQDRVEALSSLMFLKEKRTGEIKARGCVNGSKQREYIKKEDATSPTVSLESLFIIASINAFENRKVATFDIPGAFLHTETDEDVIMALEGPLAELMVKVDPKIYRKHITTNKKGKALLYVKMNKAVYGMLRSAMLFYKKLRADLEDYGFVVNPYDPCVANMTVNGSQMTVVWHVDDLHVSHADDFEITKLGQYLSGAYNGLSVRRGANHDYLGINFDYSRAESHGEVVIDQIPYLLQILRDFPERLGQSKATPAADHLFDVRADDEARFLPEDQAAVFHRTVAQLLFIAPRARRDIQTAIAFLTTRVKKPDEDDWGKLKRVLQYLKGTRNLKLTLKVTDLSTIRWWVDASYAVHADCKGHTGAMMTLGEGATTSVSTKQKINGRSSTENELIGADDILPRALWTKYFIEAQGYEVKRNIMFQDNKSCILLETNGKFSSSRRTKHIKNRYFLITDKIEQGDLEVEYCPTEKMWCDGHTKPKQGHPFRLDRAAVMNCPVDYFEDETSHEDIDMVDGKLKPGSVHFVKIDGKRIPVRESM